MAEAATAPGGRVDLRAASARCVCGPDVRARGRLAAAIRTETRRGAFDALIAAIAMANQLPLYTCNPRDYDGIEGLDVVGLATSDAGAATVP